QFFWTRPAFFGPGSRPRLRSGCQPLSQREYHRLSETTANRVNSSCKTEKSITTRTYGPVGLCMSEQGCSKKRLFGAKCLTPARSVCHFLDRNHDFVSAKIDHSRLSHREIGGKAVKEDGAG